MRTRLLLVLASVAALAACGKVEPVAEPVRAVRTMTITAQSTGGTREYAAEVRARTESRLSFRVGGKMLRRGVDLGDSVKAGQVLAQLDPRDLALGQDAARAAVTSAQVSYDQSVADFSRYENLRAQDFISSAELERRDTVLKAAKAQLDMARAQLGVQGNQAGYASLMADASGVITGVDAEPGMVVAAGAPVVRLAHDGPRDAVFAVPEDQVALVKILGAAPGRISVRLWGGAGTPIEATVREISAAADPATRTFQVKADLGAADVRLGASATVVMSLPRSQGVVKLPLSALREAQGRTIVWLVDPNRMTLAARTVQLAGAEGNEAVITAGLAPGQVVVTAGVHVLEEGQKVRFWVDPGISEGAGSALDAKVVPVGVK